MVTAIDRSEFLADPSVKPISRDQRVDLTAPDTKQLSEGKFVIFSNRTERGSIEIIRYIVPYAFERTDVDTPQESMRMLDPRDANGFFAFSPLVNGQTPITLQINYNAPRNIVGPLLNADRQIRSGISHISNDPWIDVQRYNPLFAIPVPSDTEFTVTFELLPPAQVNALSNPYQIGTGAKRVDFAGVIVSGVKLPNQLYEELMAEVLNKKEG